MKLTILSGGAAQGLVAALAAAFKAQSGCEIDGTFGAVGAMRDKLLSGTAADLLILTRALIDELGVQGHVVAGSATNIGTVLTAVAVRSGEPSPDVGNAAGQPWKPVAQVTLHVVPLHTAVALACAAHAVQPLAEQPEATLLLATHVAFAPVPHR